jgi:hypothetical protein
MQKMTIIDLRPQLVLKNDAEDSPILYFQNNTLRPILKMLNDQFHMISELWMPKLKNITVKIERKTYIQNFLNKNPAEVNLLLGTCYGLMTIEELKFSLENEKEVKKRIKDMFIERIA